MKKLLLHLLPFFILFTLAACGGDTQDTAEEGKAPVSADDPRAPTMAPDKPTTDIGAGLEDSLKRREQKRDSL